MAKPQTKITRKARTAVRREADRPATTVPDSSAIAALAYQLWQARGCPGGTPEIDWLLAEQELTSQPIQPKSPSTKRPLLTRPVGA